MSARRTPSRTASLVTLGCARNDVDSEELAARLEAGGWRLVDDADTPTSSWSTPAASSRRRSRTRSTRCSPPPTRARKVVAVGCLAERYGERARRRAARGRAVLGFDDYADIGDGSTTWSPAPITRAHPARPPHAAAAHPGRAAPRGPRPRARPRCTAPRPPRTARRARPGERPAADAAAARRRAGRPAQARLRLRPPLHVLRDPVVPRRLRVPPRPSSARRGRAGSPSRASSEIVLVSENSTSYGKDLGDLRALERLLPRLAAVDGVERVRVSYLQPAELRPGLIDVIAGTAGRGAVLRPVVPARQPPRAAPMRRFGDPERFLGLLERDPRARPAGGRRGRTSSSASPARPRRSSPSSTLPQRGAARRDRRVRLLRRGGHRGGRVRRQARPGRDRRAGRRLLASWPRS